MKVRNRIFYYSVLSVIILYAAYNFVQKAVISPLVRKNLIEKIGPALKSDKFDIENINLSLNQLSFRNIVFEKKNTRVIVKNLNVKFSIKGSFINLITLKGWFFEAESVEIAGCDILISPEMKTDIEKPWDFKFEDFKLISDLLKEYDFIKAISLKDVNLIYNADMTLPVIRELSGSAAYNSDGNISMDLDGKFLNSPKENIFLEGFIDNTKYTAEIDLNFENDEFSNFKSPFGIYEIIKGKYSGEAKLEINKSSEEEMNLTGNFKLNDLDLEFNKVIYMKETNLDLSYFNGVVSMNSLNGTLNGIRYHGEGKIFNLLNPSGDIYFNIEKIRGSEITKALNIARLDKNFYENIIIGDDNSLSLHVTDQLIHPVINYDLNVSSLSYKNNSIKDIGLNGYYSGREIVLSEGSMFVLNNILKFSGKLTDIYSDKPQYFLDFKSTGALFSNFPVINSDYLKDQSTIIEGCISGKIGEFPKMKAELTAFDFSKDESVKNFSCGISLKNNSLNCSVSGRNSETVLSGIFDIGKKEYSLSGSDLMSFYELIYGYKLLEKENSLYFELKGSNKYFELKTGSKDERSLFYGNLDAKFDLSRETLESFVNWMPGATNILNRPANFRFKKSDDIISVSDIYFDSKEITGMVSLNIKDKVLSGQLETKNMDFGKFFGVKDLKTNTDLVLKVRGIVSSPYIDFYINENILKYYDAEKDSLIISGEAEAHLENKKLRLEKIIIYEGFNKIVTLSGSVRDFEKLDLSAYGEIKAEFFNAFLNKVKLKGDMNYKIDFTGKLNDFRLKNSEITLTNGYINGDAVKKFEFVTSELDSTGVLVKKMTLDGGKYLQLNAEGFIPYKEDEEIYVRGDFSGDFINYIDKKTKLISKGSSKCEGNFTIGGKFNKPKLNSVELNILDGKFTPKGAADPFNKISAKILIDENYNLDIVKFKMHSDSYTAGSITIDNDRTDRTYGDIILPGGINAGCLRLKVSDGGIDYHAFNMMIPDDYGNFVLAGKTDNKFRIYKKNGNLVLDGKVFLRNSRITYPFLNTDSKSDKSKDPDDSNDSDSKLFFSDIELDIEVIPAGGNIYFFNVDSEEKSIWGRIVRTFTQFDNELSNVNINVTPASKGLVIKGPVHKPRELQLTGDFSGKNGTCNYSAFSFKVDNVSIRFDGQKNNNGFTDPYLKASAVTTVKTKIDSTGFSGYETIYLKVVTKEDEQVVDSEGARISGMSIILTDEFGNPWFDKDDKLFEIDTKGTAKELFNEAVDTRFLSPIISPVELAIGRALGATVSIRPYISGNFMNNELGILEIPENYAEYFVGSEFYISKFLTDDIALTWNSKYIGSEEYTEITERDYGYRNNLSLDFRLNNYIFTSAGYQYDSIQEEYGYNLAVSYRYRFMNISEPYHYMRKILLGY